MDEKILGKRIRKLRQDKKLTMKQLGEKFSLAESTISGYENGNRKPDMDLVIKLADFFEVSVDYLYGREEKQLDHDNLFFFDMEGLTEEEINDIKRHIDYVKWKAKQERGE
ncbi:helix-turn-helix domain-containing protein [Gracilibacillus caseinilyticus]|uniref:Helix-turn-helix domain-containing protein n=1 Tax=Gracilibacillus caseinilyticus TaxID=2932256 RepID=A0ABY4ETJ8_9BACI|nr:helix-turn-helix transcriptional regulator [Gracilibacillus caseinilyticus]UOQ47208.1 helix-turn-helix domain-containing protein [Gracilibacillus caseinilyticus]